LEAKVYKNPEAALFALVFVLISVIAAFAIGDVPVIDSSRPSRLMPSPISIGRSVARQSGRLSCRTSGSREHCARKQAHCRWRVRLLLLTAFTGFALPSLGSVIEKENREWYEVRQLAGTSLLNALNAASPVREMGRTFHAYTGWDIRWSFRWNTSAAGLCSITSVTTNLSVRMTLPRIVSSTSEGATEFGRYFPALLTHEQGHKAIAVEAANEVDRLIGNLRPAAKCQALEAQANRTGMAILESAKRKGVEYDARTEHGCTQGACLIRQR